MTKKNGVKLSSSANTFIMLITSKKDISLSSILASSLSLFIFAITLTQYLVFFAFMAEPSLAGVGACAGVVLGARAGDAAYLVVLAFLGGWPRAMGIPVMACFTVASSKFLALGGRRHPCPISADNATDHLGSGAGTFRSMPWASARASASAAHRRCRCRISCSSGR